LEKTFQKDITCLVTMRVIDRLKTIQIEPRKPVRAMCLSAVVGYAYSGERERLFRPNVNTFFS